MNVRVEKSNAIMLQGTEGSTLGVGGAWREPLPLYNHCEGENDAPELRGAEECK